jgi:hypothetical protein
MQLVGKASLLTFQLVRELLQSGEHGSETTWELRQAGATICDTFFVYQVDKFISACVLNMGTMPSLAELSMSGLKCLKMAVGVWLMLSAQATQPQPQPHRMNSWRTDSSKQKSDGQWNCKTTEYQHWVCLFCGAW